MHQPSAKNVQMNSSDSTYIKHDRQIIGAVSVRKRSKRINEKRRKEKEYVVL